MRAVPTCAPGASTAPPTGSPAPACEPNSAARVQCLLAKHGYLPDAIKLVLTQMETFAGEWASELQ